MDRSQLINSARSNIADLSRGNLGVPLLLLVMLAMMMLPVPPFLLDVFFTFNIALSIVVLLVCVYALRPLDFAVFPTILLVATLLRLALNVASTRVVMLHGQDGHAAAGKVIQAFGEVVIGGNYVVGIVVFAILMIINFVVVTKGAGRISEVSARFTLDAMPGKQMAIDADLNQGAITDAQAKVRREKIQHEADFFGAMDGASKFVKGDAIDLGQPFRFAAFGQQLQGADAVPADSREQVERFERACLEPGRNAFANDVTVRQQALKVVGNTGTLEWFIA